MVGHKSATLNIALGHRRARADCSLLTWTTTPGAVAWTNWNPSTASCRRTISVITGRGEHLYFKLNGHAVRNSAGLLGPGLDVRGDGGYVLLPPSIHPSGRAYAWSVDSTDEYADAPEWLYELLQPSKQNGGAKGKPLEHWHRVLTNPIQNGERNTTLASVCGKLLHFGVKDVTLLLDMMLCVNIARCDEPLPEKEVETIVVSVVQSYLRKLRGND